ncbi:MAG: MCE family protein, partial [Bacteroidetes bacterium]|nr:MCE family protein [Bacteroidota bacterium]
KTAAVSSEQATAKINSLVSRLDNNGTLIHELTTDTSVYANFKNTIVRLRTTSETISDFADSLKKTSGSLNKNDNAVGLLLHDKEVASDLKEITKNLNTSSRKLDEDLKALQHNFLLRKYFRKKEKQEKAKQDSSKIKL